MLGLLHRWLAGAGSRGGPPDPACTRWASRSTSPSSVADRNRVCRSVGTRRTIALHVGEEAHVEHAVGLVEHQDPHGVQADPSLRRSQVVQAAGRGHQDVGPVSTARRTAP